VSAPERTPGPWVAGEPAWFRGRTDPSHGKRPITAGAHGVVANSYGADADFIVRACNAHDDLVAALRRVADSRLLTYGQAEELGVYAALSKADPK
jgi:hypothetical protein